MVYAKSYNLRVLMDRGADQTALDNRIDIVKFLINNKSNVKTLVHS